MVSERGKCESAVKISGVEMRCIYRKDHDGMHRTYTLWADSGYIEWASGHELSYEMPKPKRHLRLAGRGD